MPPDTQSDQNAVTQAGARLRGLLPVALLGAAMAIVFAMGWHRQVSLETLIRYRSSLDAFVSAHQAAALAAYVGVYIVSVALSIPGAVFLTVAGGALFGWLVGGGGAVVGATAGALLVFLAASGAFRDLLARRAGAVGAKIAAGFQRDAFSYLLFLRLVPVFPFWLINIAAALVGVRPAIFVAATLIGIVPGTFAFAFLGQGLDGAIAAQRSAFDACVAAGRSDCRLDFDLRAAFTTELIAALIVLALVALSPILIKRLRGISPIAK